MKKHGGIKMKIEKITKKLNKIHINPMLVLGIGVIVTAMIMFCGFGDSMGITFSKFMMLFLGIIAIFASQWAI